MPKHALREELLARRRHCSAETCLALSLEVQNRFLQSKYFRQARCLALYSAICNEVLTDEVARQTVAKGKRLVYPRVSGDVLEFVEVNGLESLSPGSFGVLEPLGTKTTSLPNIDLIIVPGVAFDRFGHRLGYGKGFYDRTLSRLSTTTICLGFAYDFQVVESLPVSAYDRPVSILMTESSTIHFH